MEGASGSSDDPRREEWQWETDRLLALCVSWGVEAVLIEVGNRPALLAAVADACRSAGLISEAQYLDYCANPYD